MSQLKVNSIVDASGGSNAQLYGVASPPNSMGFRNRLLNSDMRIDQRNNGAAVTTASSYPVDRWLIAFSNDGAFSSQRSTTAPAGFSNSLYFTTTTADSSLAAGQFVCTLQRIEGFNVADLGWGAAGAQTVTLSFWTRSTLTGTFGGSLRNGASTRSYPFTYTISAANTWEYKTVTVPGDTTGTWETGNGVGIDVIFGLGVGSSFGGTAGAWASSNFLSATGAVSVIGTLNATFYITGVQLEAGTVASAFERRDYGRELIMCQRYYQKYVQPPLRGLTNGGTTCGRMAMVLPVVMRGAPTSTVGALPVFDCTTTATVSSILTNYTTATVAEYDFNLSGSLNAARPVVVYQSGAAALELSAEL